MSAIVHLIEILDGVAYEVTGMLTLSALSSHSMGSRDLELPDATLSVTVFSPEISKPILRLCGDKSKTCRPVFRPYGDL